MSTARWRNSARALPTWPAPVEIVVHPSPPRDPDFPSDMHYGPRQRYIETEYLMRALDRLRALGIAT